MVHWIYMLGVTYFYMNLVTNTVYVYLECSQANKSLVDEQLEQAS